MVKSKTKKKQENSYKKRLQPFRKEHVNGITRGVAAMNTGQSRSISKNTISKRQSSSSRKKAISNGQNMSKTPFFLAPPSIPSPPTQRDAMDALTGAMERTKINIGGYRNKSRRHKSRRHKTRRHKTRRHKSRR